MNDPNRWTLVVAVDSVGAAATVLRADGTQEVLEVEGRARIESVVAVDEGGLLVAGPAAAKRAAERPAWSLRDPFRRLVTPAPVVLGASRHAGTEVAATVIGFFARLGAARIGRPAAAVRVACPEWWDDDARHRLRSAAAAAGFTSCELVGAAEAAVTAHRFSGGASGGSAGAATVVYDVQAAEVVLSVFGPDGRPSGSPARLPTWGVDLIDEQLVDVVGARLDPRGWDRLQHSEDPEWLRAAADLRRACAGVRRSASAGGVDRGAGFGVVVDTPDGRVEETVRAFEVASLVSEHVATTADNLRMLLGDRGFGLDPVVRVAGEPLAGTGEALRAAMPMATVVADFPQLATLYGVALVGEVGAVGSAGASGGADERGGVGEVAVEPTVAMPMASAPTQVISVRTAPAPQPPRQHAPLPPGPPRRDRDADHGRGRALWLAAAALVVAFALGGAAYALTGRGDDTAGAEAGVEAGNETETSTTTAPTTPATEATSRTTDGETTTTAPSASTTTTPSTSTSTTQLAPADPALSSVLLTDADLPGWSPDVFSFDDEVSVCGLAPVATPVEAEGRAWFTPTPSGEANWSLSNWIERYATASEAQAVHDRDVELPDDCLDTTIDVGGLTFDATFETNTSDFDALGVGDVVVLSGVLTHADSGVELNLLSAAQVWGRHYTIVQLVSTEPFDDAILEDYILLIQEAFERSTELPR